MKKLLVVFSLLLALVSCVDHKDDNYVYNHSVDIATVENPDQSTMFNLKLDNNTVLKTVVSEISYYRPKHGQRVIANYTVLSTLNDSSVYKYTVKLNDVYEILTKGILPITPQIEDSIGNNPVRIHEMWIGSDYLNVEFDYPGYNKIHYINLVSDSLKTYTDNKIHLEFRHNANDDYPSYTKWGLVSFDLRSLKALATADSLNLVIHTKEYTNKANETYELTYKFNVTQSASAPNVQFRRSAEKIK